MRKAFFSHGYLPVVMLFLSGGCALIFQTAWLREFRLIFGGSTPATAAVLSIFMGGLGLGNALLGNYANRHAQPFRLYGYLEAIIAISAALSPFLIDGLGAVYLSLGGQASLGIMGATMVRMLLATLVLAAPTICMGGTLPAIAKAVTWSDDTSRTGAAFFYGMNTLGAVAGTLFSTFYLLEALGTRGTLWSAAVVNILLALLATRVAWTTENQSATTIKLTPAKREDVSIHAKSHAIPAWFVFSAAVIVGAAFFLMELVWYRMLGPLLGGTTFTFGLILASALLGIGLGGALYSLLFRRCTTSLLWFAWTCVLEALCVILPFVAGDELAIFAVNLREHWRSAGFFGVAGSWAMVACLVVGPASLISGIQFPLLISLLGRGNEDIGKHVGKTCAWNTVGAILGSLLGGFGFLPMLSAPGAWRLVVIILLALAACALILELSLRRVSWRILPQLFMITPPAIIGVVACLCLTATGPTAIWRHSGIGAGRSMPPSNDSVALQDWKNSIRRRVIWERDGREASIGISVENGIGLMVNGKSDGNSIGDAATQIMLGSIGPLLHPQPKTSLLVGLGTGESAGWLAETPSMERVDVVELESAVDEMAKRCAPLNFSVLEHPKVNRIYNDAREVLRTTPETYDVIVSEPSNPYRAGVATLFTREFYQSVSQRLRPQGVFVQWLQGYEISRETMGMVCHTLRERFDHIEIWRGTIGDMLFVCSHEPISFDVAAINARIQQEPLRSAVYLSWGAVTAEAIASRHLANNELVNKLADESQRINTDDNNILEYSFARSLSGFTSLLIGDIASESNALNMNRPQNVLGILNDERAEIERCHIGFWPDLRFVSKESESKVYDTRLGMLRAYFRGEISKVLSADYLEQPVGPLETITATHALVLKNDPRSPELLARLAKHSPTAHACLTSLWHLERKEIELAKTWIVKSLESMSHDPFVFAIIFEEVIAQAMILAEQDRDFAQKIATILAQPFLTYAYNITRVDAQVALADLLPLPERIKIYESLEPYPLWDRDYLRRRREAYREAKHRLFRQAVADYERFRSEN